MPQSIEKKLFIFTVISEEYARLGLVWGRRVEVVSGIRPHFICSDVDAFQFLRGNDFPCTLMEFSEESYNSSENHFGEVHFPSKKAIYTVSLKLKIASKYLKEGFSILYSDVDAIWLKNPLGDITPIEADFLFQPGSFPEEAKSLWGFSVCTGFFLLRPNAQTIAFADAVNQGFDGDDQRTLNQVLMTNYDIEWSAQPKTWEHCSISGGWTKPILGRCSLTDLTAAALGHSFYQRHGTAKDTCDHAIVCHPNSPKDQDGKFAVFEELGISLDVLEVQIDDNLQHKPTATSIDKGRSIVRPKFLDRIRKIWSSSQG